MADSPEQKLRKLTTENKDLSEFKETADSKIKGLRNFRERFTTAVAVRESPARRFAVDWGGGLAAQAAFELVNWGVRSAAEASGTGWIARNSHWLQGVPHFVIGNALYFAELAMRKEITKPEDMPSGIREGFSESAKIFGQLGFSNIARAIRLTLSDSKDAKRDQAALLADAQAEVARLRARVASTEASK